VLGAEETSKEIDVAQETYRPVATRGSILYFVVAEFTTVDPMYQVRRRLLKQHSLTKGGGGHRRQV